MRSFNRLPRSLSLPFSPPTHDRERVQSRDRGHDRHLLRHRFRNREANLVRELPREIAETISVAIALGAQSLQLSTLGVVDASVNLIAPCTGLRTRLSN